MGIFQSKTCQVKTCKNTKVESEKVSRENIKYCKDHTCQFPLCLDKKAEGSENCAYHKCSNCSNPALRGDYCINCYLIKHNNK